MIACSGLGYNQGDNRATGAMVAHQTLNLLALGSSPRSPILVL